MSETKMALERGSIRGFEHHRMVMLFSMMDGENEVPCAVSNLAMDEMDHVAWTTPDRREEQFFAMARPDRTMRHAKIPRRCIRGKPPGIILRSLDFRDQP